MFCEEAASIFFKNGFPIIILLCTPCKLFEPSFLKSVQFRYASHKNIIILTGEGILSPEITSPSGEKIKPIVKDNEDGTYAVEYTPTEEGPHTIDVKYDGDSIPGTPKDVDVLPKTDTGKVKAYGPGLENALTGQKAQFTVDTREAGVGILNNA